MMATNLFQGGRIFLRAFEPQDLPAFHAYLNQPDLIGRRYIPWRFPSDLPLSLAQAEAILKTWAEGEHQLHTAIVLQQDETLIGHANAGWRWDRHCPNLDLVISPAYQQQGYGSEVLELLLAYFFENTPAHSLDGGMENWNQPAQSFAHKHGFTHSGTIRRTGLRQGAYYDWLNYDLLRPEWLDRKGGA